MSTSSSPQVYGASARVIHWAAAILVVAAWIVGFTMEEMERGQQRDLAMQIHYSLGFLVLGAAVLRVVWRAVVQAAPAGGDAPSWQTRIAFAMHVALIGLTVALPLTGLLDRWARGRVVTVFGGWVVSPPFAVPGGKFLGETHEVLANLLVAAVAAHVAAALWHHFVLRDQSLARMLPRFGR